MAKKLTKKQILDATILEDLMTKIKRNFLCRFDSVQSFVIRTTTITACLNKSKYPFNVCISLDNAALRMTSSFGTFHEQRVSLADPNYADRVIEILNKHSKISAKFHRQRIKRNKVAK